MSENKQIKFLELTSNYYCTYLKVKFENKNANKDTVTSHHTTLITDFSGNTTTFFNF
jgi:hypothetical protein